MAGVLDKTKVVFFIGAWRAQQVTDQLLRQISQQIGSKKKVATKLSISAEGLELLILNPKGQVTRKDKIALENIVDFINNKYSTTCTLAIVRDKQRKLYTVFVFQCKSDRDASFLIQNFKHTKQQLSGEGYNTNLTPKGKNWTLQQKSMKTTHQTLNGDIKGRTVIGSPNADVHIISTEKQNGGVTVITNGERHDSISRDSVKTASSEMKEELHHLADEVRDIKRLLQGSKGRAQFENHYGYRIIQGPSVTEFQRPTEYIEREVRPVEVRRENIYLKNGAHTRYVEAAPQSIRVGRGMTRSTKRHTTKGHFVTALSPTRAEYTQRVYESPNPFVETGQRIQPVKVVTRNTQPVLVPRTRLYQSQSSDIVHKNIEDVYRSRSLRKVYLPQSLPTSNSSVEYVNSQMIQNIRHIPTKNVSQDVEQNAVHVKYSPEVRTYYETTEESNSSGVSTNVNTSVNDNPDDKLRQIESSLNVQQNVPMIERNDNVIIIEAEREKATRSSIEDMGTNIVYVEDYNDVQREIPSMTTGGNVHHVRAEFAEDYETSMGKDENLTVVKTNNTEVHRNNIGFVPIADNAETVERRVSFEEYTAENVDDESTGLFGAYVKKPDEFDETQDDINAETSYRYHEEEVEIQESKTEQLHSEKEDNGLFGAYTKTPEEYDERDIVEENAYRYHENELNTETNGDEKVEHFDTQELKESFEEKRVRYNENVEQIPAEDNEPDHIVETIHTDDVYAAERHGESQGDQFRNELSVVVSKIRHNYDEKLKNENTNDVVGNEDDEKYEFDMNALQAFSAEPDIIIVDADNEKMTETLRSENKLPAPDADYEKITETVRSENKLPAPEEESSTIDFVKERIIDKRDSLKESKSAVMEELRNGTKHLVNTKDEILEITRKTEDTVLF